jgi:hypothetical protein
MLAADLEVGYTPRPERRTLVRIDSIVQTQATFQGKIDFLQSMGTGELIYRIVLQYSDGNGYSEVI